MTYYGYTEQDYRTDIANTTPSQAGYEHVVRLGENNGWSSDAVRKIIDEVWAGKDWVEEEAHPSVIERMRKAEQASDNSAV